MSKNYVFILGILVFGSLSSAISKEVSCKEVLSLESAIQNLRDVTVLTEFRVYEYFQSYREDCPVQVDALLGVLYFQHLGNIQDQQKGINYLLSASSHGDVGAMAVLGSIYLGNSEFRDIGKGVHFLEQAALKGDAVAMANLYIASLHGYFDPDKGRRWLVNAMESGNEVAALHYAQMLRIKAEEEKNFQYLHDAIEHLKAFSFEKQTSDRDYYLSQLLLNPKTPYFDTEEGLQYLEQAAEAGHPRAVKEWSAYKDWLEEK